MRVRAFSTLLLILTSLANPAGAAEPLDEARCTPEEYVEFASWLRAHRSRLRNYILEPFGSITGTGLLDLLGLATLSNYTFINQAGTVGYNAIKHQVQDARLRDRTKVRDALRDAREILSGRTEFVPQQMQWLSILYAKTNLRLKRRVSLEEFLFAFLGSSDRYCQVGRKGPRMIGTGGVEDLIVESLNLNQGPTQDQTDKARTLAGAPEAPHPEDMPPCEPARYLRLLRWKFATDGSARWDTYAGKAVRPIVTGIYRDELGFQGASALSVAGNVLGGAAVRYLGFRLDRRKVQDREKLMSALEAAHVMVASDSDSTSNAAFNSLKPEGWTARKFATELSRPSNVEALCRASKNGKVDLVGSKDAVEIIQPEAGPAS